MNYKIIITAIVAATVAVSFGFITEPHNRTDKAFGEMYQPIWENAVASTVEVARAMPEDMYGYKPTDVSKSFGQQIIHIAYGSHFMSKALLKGEKGDYSEPVAEEMTKDEIIDYAETELRKVADLISGMSEDEWVSEIQSFGGNMMPKSQAMIFIQDHLTNHRAKANLYIRINNIDPPKYMYY